MKATNMFTGNEWIHFFFAIHQEKGSLCIVPGDNSILILPTLSLLINCYTSIHLCHHFPLSPPSRPV